MASSGITGLPARFRVEEEIGRGGMSIVYRAHDTRLDRFVAIKVLSEVLSGAVDVERFEREISVMARLSHPGIVSLFDSGVADGRLYYVMPFVPGETLRARLARERRLTMEEAASIGADIAEALAFAHDARIVHRDVKPENIFIVGGRALLADFGIAHIVASGAGEPDIETRTTATSLTTAEAIVGTIPYISPEQAAGDRLIDARSDLYSLGCVLYELVTGAPPFTGGTVAVIGQHLKAAPKPLAERGVRVSPALSALVDALLAKDPADRPAGAAEVARLLRAAPAVSDMSSRAPAGSEADRLVAEGIKAFRLGAAGGPASRSLLDQAEVYLTRALAQDPKHTRALVVYGNWHYVMERLHGLPAEEAHAKGRELVMAALASDDRVAEVHSSLAKAALYYDDDCYIAERHAKRAVELDPTDHEALRTYSIMLKIQGRFDEAIETARAAVARAPEMTTGLNALADALLMAGRPTEAVEVLRRVITLLPGRSPSLERMEGAYVQLGDFESAVDYRSSRLRAAGDSDRAQLLVDEASAFGPEEARRRDLQRELDRLLAQARDRDPFAETYTVNSLGDRIALAYAQLGECGHAVTWIERAFAHRPARLRRLLMDLPFDRRQLATDRRFVRLLRVAGLEDLLPS